MGNNVEWDIPRMRKAMVVLQECVVTKTLEYGDVGGLFDFVMLLPAAKQARSRDVDDTSLANLEESKCWFWIWMARLCGHSSRKAHASWSHVLSTSALVMRALSTTSCMYLLGRYSLACDTLHPPTARAAPPFCLA